MGKIIFEILVLTFFCGLVTADHVPVFIWGTDIRYEPALALKFHSGDDFIDILTKTITANTVTFIITEDKLTTEDLAQCKTEHGSCFQGIQQITEKLYLPNVEDPVANVKDIAGTDKIEIKFFANGSLSESLNTLPNYVFIDFDESTNGEIETNKFVHHDRLIIKLCNELLSKNQRMLFIFTGKSNRYQKRFIREVLDKDAKKKAVRTYCFAMELLMFYENAHIVDEFRNDSLFFDVVTAVNAGTTIVDKNYLTQINVTLNVTESEDALWFTIIGTNGYWFVNELTFNDDKISLSIPIAAVYNQSFHCTPAIELYVGNKTHAGNKMHKTAVLTFRELQIQPNFNSSVAGPLHEFGAAWDCVYFFSPGILSGLSVVFLLMFILFISIACIMDINVNDRFIKSKKEPNFSVID